MYGETVSIYGNFFLCARTNYARTGEWKLRFKVTLEPGREDSFENEGTIRNTIGDF